MKTETLFIVSILSFVGYFLTNKRPYKFVFKTGLDQKIKLIPIFVIPYLLLFPLIIFSYYALSLSQNFEKFLIAIFVANLLATIFWYAVPNGVSRPKLEKKTFMSRLLDFVYSHDGDTNGFPSSHVFLSLLCSYFLSLSLPQHQVLWVFLGIIISISTVFTKQHYIVDILGGVLFACLAILGAGVLSL